MTGRWQDRARAAAAHALGSPPDGLALDPLSIRATREVYACHGRAGQVVAKCFPDAGRAREAGRALELLGGRHGIVAVPRCLHFDPELLVLVQEHLEGQPYGPLLRGAEPGPAVARAARATADLHAIDVTLPRSTPRDGVLAAGRAAIERLNSEVDGAPGVREDGAVARAALDRAESLLARESELAHAPAHGDLGWAQLLDCGDVVGIVDFDKAAQAEPALDIGNLLAQLVRSRGSGGLALRAALVESYEETAGRRVAGLVEPYALVTLVRKLAFVDTSVRPSIRAALELLMTSR